MKKRLTTVIAVFLSLTFLMLPGCSSKDSGADGEDKTFSYWISASEDSSYYETYRDNPSVQYLLDHTTYENENGEFNIDLEFIVPVTGSEEDNFNTLLATDEYADIMELSHYRGSIVELYEDGTILDLTEYVEKYMPNYKSWLDNNPENALTATNTVDGEKKYLQLYSYIDNVNDQYFCGFNYRRDWLVKYGTNPDNGSAFSGSFTAENPDGTPDPNSWEDNVVFPSGGAHPVYISDWEWMFEIFTAAIQDQGINDGYCISLYYPGYSETGDLVSAFGGSGSHWYKDKDDQIQFGANSENFRVYLQAMSTWYENGWIDKAFTEHSSDMFFRIDDAKVRQGKVGLWIGSDTQRLNTLDDPNDPLLEGMMIFTARQPINDIYGGAEQQNVEPYCMFQPTKEISSFAVSDKAAEKDLPALFTFFDHMYSEEGSLLKMAGLSKEQYEVSKNELYTKSGLTDGAYYWIDTEDGQKYQYDDIILADGGRLRSAIPANRIFGLRMDLWAGREPLLQEMIDQWDYYPATGNLPKSFTSQLSAEDAKTFSKIELQVREFMNKNTPAFINGSKDPFNDGDWDAFVDAVAKYSPDENTQIYQNLLDQLK